MHSALAYIAQHNPFGTWDWHSVYWLCWVVLGFGGMETYAIVSGHPEWTLSDQFWRMEGNFTTWNPARIIIAGLLFGLFFWLWPHIVDHIWR